MSLPDAIKWEFKFRLKATNGTSTYEYKPYTTYNPTQSGATANTVVHVRGLATENYEFEHEMLDLSRANDRPGFYQHFLICLERVFAGAFDSDAGVTSGATAKSLEDLLSQYYVSGWDLYLTLNGDATTPTWTKVDISDDGEGERSLEDDLNIGVSHTLEFRSCALMTTRKSLLSWAT